MGPDWHVIDKCDWWKDMVDVPQDKVWHAEGNVQIHTKMVCNALIESLEFQKLSEQDRHIMFHAALWHDIEKRSTTATEWVESEGRNCVTAKSHARHGSVTVRSMLYRDMCAPFHIREEICALIKYHGVPLWGINDEDAVQKVIKTSFHCRNSLLAMIARADVLGRECDDEETHLENLDFFELLCQDYKCWDKPREFETDLARNYFFQQFPNFKGRSYLVDGALEYVPYEKNMEKTSIVYLMCALPGAGKDFYIKNTLENIPMVSIDRIRREKKVKYGDKKGNGQAIQEAKEKCKVHMREKEDFVFNATNITADMRSKWIKEFIDYRCKVVIVYIEVPYTTLLRQNLNREHSIPTKALEGLIDKLDVPTIEECYKVNYIMEKTKLINFAYL